MKMIKLLTFIICIAMCVCFVGCAEKEDTGAITSVESLAHSLNIVKYAEKGKIPEIPYALGHDIENIKKTFMDHVDEGSEIQELIIEEGENTVWMRGGTMTFCYEKAKQDNGISVIVAHEYAYDFSLGGVYDADDVINAVGLENYERAKTTDKDAFFLPVIPQNSECIKYSIEGYDLRFIIIDDTLSAVTITDPKNWNL